MVYKEVLMQQEKEYQEFRERKLFIRDNYPFGESDYDFDSIISSGLDGKEVIVKKDSSGDLEGILTYEINFDNEKIRYCSIGVMLTREESRGEGIMKELFLKIKEIAKKRDCEYMVAIGDTEEGRAFLAKNNFYEEVDPVNKREHLRFDFEN